MRALKKVLIEAFKDEESRGSSISSTIAMIGPLFSINSSAKVELTHSDLQDIMNHKPLAKLNFDFKKVIKMFASDVKDKDLLTQNFEIEDLGMSFDQIEKYGIKFFDENAKRCYHDYLSAKTAIKVLDLIGSQCEIDMNFLIGDFLSGQVRIASNGLGQLLNQFLRAATYKQRERYRKNIHQDFLLASKNYSLYKELYGDVP